MATKRDATDLERDARRTNGGPEDWWRWVVGGTVLALLIIAVAEIPLFLDDWTGPLSLSVPDRP